jgi:predicted molibdopterin-dependent oxidoreductase YjgC
MSEFSNGRLTTPLIRMENGHRAASWEETLDHVVSRLRLQIETHGPRSFGMFSCSKTTNELNYVAQKFVRTVVGCNNIDSCNRT